MSGYHPRWSSKEEAFLRDQWRYYTIERIAKQLGRTPRAVEERAYKLGLGGVRGFAKSLNRIAEETGYCRKRLQTALIHLGINARVKRRGAADNTQGLYQQYAVTPEQEDRLLAYLRSVPDGRKLMRSRKGQWGEPSHRGGNKPSACIDCGRNDVPHHCKGRCRKCDSRRRRGLPPLLGGGVEQQSAAGNAEAAEHPR